MVAVSGWRRRAGQSLFAPPSKTGHRRLGLPSSSCLRMGVRRARCHRRPALKSLCGIVVIQAYAAYRCLAGVSRLLGDPGAGHHAGSCQCFDCAWPPIWLACFGHACRPVSVPICLIIVRGEGSVGVRSMCHLGGATNRLAVCFSARSGPVWSHRGPLNKYWVVLLPVNRSLLNRSIAPRHSKKDRPEGA
jgi:hypothetical protein